MFICIVTLVVTSAASAGVWDWYFGGGGASQTPYSQQQAYAGWGGQIGAQIGPGSSSGTSNSGAGGDQAMTTPIATGAQRTTVGNTQSTYIATGPRSMGATHSDFMFGTYQGQFFLY